MITMSIEIKEISIYLINRIKLIRNLILHSLAHIIKLVGTDINFLYINEKILF